MEGWHVAKVKPQKETSLISFLHLWGVEVFFPKVIQPSRTRARMQPLFPSYFFCHLDSESSIWPVVRWAPGMSYFLNHDGEAGCVPDSVVEYLQQRVSQWNRIGPSLVLKPGDGVVVLSGPFSGLEGVFQRYTSGRERCRILLEALARLGTVELSQQDVKGICPTSEASQMGSTIVSPLSG